METTPESSKIPDENILSVDVAETVGVVSVGPGGPDAPATEDAPAAEEPVPPSITDRYVEWKGLKARKIEEADIPRVLEESKVLAELCHTTHGIYGGANAVAHNQIDHTDPLRFFVSNSGEMIVNPEVIKHTKVPVENLEGCTSFANEKPKKVKRFNVVDVTYQTFKFDETLSDVIEGKFTGVEAKVFQHQTAQLNGHCIYDEDYTPLHATFGLTADEETV